MWRDILTIHPSKSFDPQCLWQRVVLPYYCVRLPGLGLRDRSPWLVLYRYKRSIQLYRRSADHSFHGYRRSRINSTSRYVKYEVTSKIYAAFLDRYAHLSQTRCHVFQYKINMAIILQKVNILSPPPLPRFAFSELCYGCPVIGSTQSTSVCSMLPWYSVANGWWRIVRPLTCGGHWFYGTLDWLRSVSLECLESYQISYGKVLKLYITVHMYVMSTCTCTPNIVECLHDQIIWYVCCWLAPWCYIAYYKIVFAKKHNV